MAAAMTMPAITPLEIEGDACEVGSGLANYSSPISVLHPCVSYYARRAIPGVVLVGEEVIEFPGSKSVSGVEIVLVEVVEIKVDMFKQAIIGRFRIL